MDIQTLKDRILKLKQEKNALIVAHNYVRGDIQDIADIVADSLVLAREARDRPEQIVIFCGVDFMAESAKILSPRKVIVHPEPKARCPMAAMADRDSIVEFKVQYPGVPVVAYVNTTADVKAVVDVCCTSANAVKIVEGLGSDRVIFVPDSNLGRHVQKQLPGVDVILWPGHCHVHDDMRSPEIEALKKEHPEAEVLAHPECRPDILDMADHIFSTEGMVTYAQASDTREFIIATEEGLTYRMHKLMPEKTFIPIENAVCFNMKKITLENVLSSLETLEPRVELPQDILRDALRPLERMIR